MKQLNEANLDLHLHTVGERASRVVLDGVELAKPEGRQGKKINRKELRP